MRRSTGIAIAFGTVVAAAVLVGFAVFWAQDACLDAGGAVRFSARQCEMAAGQYAPLFGARSVRAWAHDGLMAALAASITIALVIRALRKPSARPSP